MELTNYQEEDVPVEHVEKVLDQLIKYKNYEFLVTAYNSIGSGPASTPVTVYVGEAGSGAFYTSFSFIHISRYKRESI